MNFEATTVQVHVAFFDENAGDYKFVLLRRSSKVEVYPGLLQTITGRLELGENALEAAVRETFEETGLVPNSFHTVPYVASFFNPKSDAVCHAPVFLAVVANIDDLKLSEEHDAYELVSAESAIEKLPLPSHAEGTRICKRYILEAEEKLFEVDKTIIELILEKIRSDEG